MATNTKPHIVLISMLLTILICSLSGKYFSEKVFFANFERLGRGLSLETSFPATFNQILNTVKKEHKPGTHLVLIGGDSVFYGQGQTKSKILSSRLAQLLGSEYSVVNLAIKGGKSFELAYWVLESLSKRDSDTILVTNSNFAFPGFPDGHSVYQYFFPDAQKKGLLRKFSCRDEFLKVPDPADCFQEQNIWQELDKYLYFRDFWATLQYELFSTIWSYEPDQAWFAPHKNHIETISKYETEPANIKDHKVWLTELRKRLDVVTIKNNQGEYEFKEDFWKNTSNLVNATVIPDLRNHIFVCTVQCSRYIQEKAGSVDKKRCDMIYAQTEKVYRDLGFNSLYIGGFEENDHVDLEHLTDRGAEKVAKLLAKEIKKVGK